MTNKLAPLVLVLSIGLAGCSLLPTTSATPQISCSVVGSDSFDPVYVDGPQLSKSEFVATPVGTMLQEFFVGGEGEPEGGSFREVGGFSIVSDTYVLGYKGDDPVADFLISDGNIQGWGGCNPTWVNGDQVASRWRPVSPVDPLSTIVPILVEGGACEDQAGTNVITEVISSDVEETLEAVKITVWTREQKFQGMCAGVGIDIPTDVRLESPLGNRFLLDSGRIPAVPAKDQ